MKITDLFEVEMSSGSLQKWAASPEAEKVRVGFEFEMYFPNTETETENDDSSFDEDTTRSIRNILDFFASGNNPADSKTINRLENALYEEYDEWKSYYIDKDMSIHKFQEFMTIKTPVYYEKIAKFKDKARKELGNDKREVDREATNMWFEWIEKQWKSGDNEYVEAYRDYVEEEGYYGESDWLEQQYPLMKNISRAFDIAWPYEKTKKLRSAESWADEISDVLGIPVRSGSYASTRRDQHHANLETDSSLDTPIDIYDAGLELITPYRPLPEAMQILKRVIQFARENNIYTNRTTGLHMNVSIEDVKNVDWIKLVLFLGDRHVLDTFERDSNEYTESSLEQLEKRIQEKSRETVSEDDQAIYWDDVDIPSAMEMMKTGNIQLAKKALQSGLGRDKYQSVHIKRMDDDSSYIEFRGPGGDWLDKESENSGILRDTVFRLGRAMTIAGDPQAYRKEYAKKMYKLLSSGNPELHNPIKLFSQYNAGELSASQLKRLWAEHVLKSETNATSTNSRRQQIAKKIATPTWWQIYRVSDKAKTPLGWVKARTSGQATEIFSSTRPRAWGNYTAMMSSPPPIHIPPMPPQLQNRTFTLSKPIRSGEEYNNWAIVDETGNILNSFWAPSKEVAKNHYISDMILYYNRTHDISVWLVPLTKTENKVQSDKVTESVSDIMIGIIDYDRQNMNEGLRDTLAGLALGAGVALGGGAQAKVEKVQVSPGQTVHSIAQAFDTTPREIQRLNKLDKNYTIRSGQTLLVPSGEQTEIIKSPTTTQPLKKSTVAPAEKSKLPAKLKTLTGTTAEAIAKRLALQQGLKGLELAAFLAQIKHESWDFTSMFERGPKSRFEKLYDKKYDPAKAKDLGNTKPGDGVRYRGRGYVQLTGRDNYRRVGRLLGVDLENNPDLAARPDLAAKIALMYWKKRVRPRVTDWSNVEEVTKPINNALNGLESRKEDFAAYVKFYKLEDNI